MVNSQETPRPDPLREESVDRTAETHPTGGGRQAAHDRWAVALIAVAWAWVVLPRVIQSVTAPKFRSSVGVETTPLSGPAHLAYTGLTLALVALCFLVLVDSVRDPHPGRLTPLVVLLAPWLYLTVRDLYVGNYPDRASLAYPLVVLAVWILRPRVTVLRSLGYLVGLAAVLSIMIAVVLPSKGILISSSGELVTEDKGVLPGGILVGFLTSGNTLGQFLALGMPLVASISRVWLRWVLLATCLLALLWSASRSSFGAVALTLLAALVVGLTARSARRWVSPVVAWVPFAVVCALPFATSNPRAFTNRGFIWSQSLQWWHSSPYVGLGSDWYQRVGKTSGRLAATVFHGHNQLVQLLVTGGVVLLLLVGLQVLVATLRAGRMAASGHLVGVTYLVALAGTCMLEKSFAIVDNTGVFPVVVLPLAVILCGEFEPDGAGSGGRAVGQSRASPVRDPHRESGARRYSVTA